MQVYCKERKENVKYEDVCIYCPKYDDCPDRPGGERLIGALFFIVIFLMIVITGAIYHG